MCGGLRTFKPSCSADANGMNTVHFSAMGSDSDMRAGNVHPTEPHHCVTTQDNVGRRVPASHDLEYPEVPFPPRHLLDELGAPAMRRLVQRQHALLRGSSIGHLLPADKDHYAMVVRKIENYVIESCGGPADYTQEQRAVCIRTQHFGLTIDESGRDIWLDCLWQALEESGMLAAQREVFWNWLEPMSIRMINRRTTKAQPRRYPFAWVETRTKLPALTMCRH